MLAVLILAVTVALVVLQPRRLPPALWAALGAVAALLLGVVRPADLGVVWHATWNATFTLVGLIAASLLLDEAGFFRWLALHVTRLGGGSGRRLFVLLVVFSALVTTLFANDGGVLILTPIALELARTLRLDRAATVAFALAVGFVVDVSSLPLTISNLTNIVVADAFGIPFHRYAAHMVPVDLVTVAVTLALLYALYARAVPRRYELADLPSPTSAVRSRGTVTAGLVLLPVVTLAYFLAEPLRVPLSAVTLGAAGLLWIVAGRSRHLSSRAVLRAAPWDVVVFALGMYLVVYGLRRAGLTDHVVRLAQWAAGHGDATLVFVTGTLVALLSAVMNNLPALLLVTLGLEQARLTDAARETAALAAVVGADVGPKLTPIGSLATLLWLHVLARRGVNVSWSEYVRAGLLLTPPVLIAALAALVLLR
ncbi:arsenical efflux pump membrane protein ArsB [Deinococcus pimensis]|uniref:arsenical efflux pump membrane protein ArsB n=1 Tax=Deinococcus pimensis TaxID=309888 RepID=UPI0004877C8A|nr:arsenical efflux pump membrane protein ArsB [Deinococcus pimensis]